MGGPIARIILSANFEPGIPLEKQCHSRRQRLVTVHSTVYPKTLIPSCGRGPSVSIPRNVNTESTLHACRKNFHAMTAASPQPPQRKMGIARGWMIVMLTTLERALGAVLDFPFFFPFLFFSFPFFLSLVHVLDAKHWLLQAPKRGSSVSTPNADWCSPTCEFDWDAAVTAALGGIIGCRHLELWNYVCAENFGRIWKRRRLECRLEYWAFCLGLMLTGGTWIDYRSNVSSNSLMCEYCLWFGVTWCTRPGE